MNFQRANLQRKPIFKKIGSNTWFSLICLGIIGIDLALGITAAQRDHNNLLLSATAIGAILLACWLGNSLLGFSQAFLVFILAGTAIILLEIPDTFFRLLTFIRVLIEYTASGINWDIGLPFPDPYLLVNAGQEFFQTGFAYIERFILWIGSLFSGEFKVDKTSAGVFLRLAVWTLMGWASWATFRFNQPLKGILPAALLLAFSLAWTRTDYIFTLPVFTATLLLVGGRAYYSRERSWEQENIDAAETLRFDAMLWLVAVTFLITMAAIIISPFSPQKALKAASKSRPPQGLKFDEVLNSFGLQRPASQDAQSEFSDPGVLPRQHLLGTGPEMSEKIVMLIQNIGDNPKKSADAPWLQPPYDECSLPECQGMTNYFYRRERIYDQYTGHGWTTSPTTSRDYDGDEIAWSEDQDRVSIIQERVWIIEDIGKSIYAPGNVVTVDQPFQIEWRTTGDSENDFFHARLQNPPQWGGYLVTSAIHSPIIEQNKSIPEYPERIIENYLQLPSILPERVIHLASEITKNLQSSYSRAQALEKYIRSIPYSLSVPQPPTDQEVVDYYLFDLRQGYCDYAATAMVVLARASGLPARFASGFASGRYDPSTGYTILTEADAHAWAEIYFPGVGWIEFEPTGVRPSISHIADNQLLESAEIEIHQKANRSLNSPQIWWGIGLFSFMGFTAALSWFFWPFAQSWIWIATKKQNALINIFYEMGRAFAALGILPLNTETPYEFARRFGKSFSSKIARKPTSFLFSTEYEINQLVGLYSRAVYSPHGVGEMGQYAAIKIWRSLGLRLRMFWLLKKIETVGRRFKPNKPA